MIEIVELLVSLLVWALNGRKLTLFSFVFHFDVHRLLRLSYLLYLNYVSVLVLDLFIFIAFIFLSSPFTTIFAVPPSKISLPSLLFLLFSSLFR